MKDKPVILVVDDHPQNIELLEAFLAPQGYEIITAANGEEALRKLSGNQIDLILLDVIMPGMNGFEVTRRVRQDHPLQLPPIILVTALREAKDRVEGIEAGCDDFISRPVDKMELLARVRSLLKIKAYNDLMSNYQKELEATKISADEAREYAESIINTVREPLIVLDHDLRVVKVSRSFYEFFKVKSEETIGQLIYDLGNKQWDISKLRELLETILPEKATFDNYEVEHDFTTIGKRIMLLNARQIKRALGKERIILLTIEDITERKRSQEQIKQLAFYDALTNLPNRRLMLERLNLGLVQAKRFNRYLVIMFMDLDHFKEINDTLGHDVGDELLKVVAERLRVCARGGDTVSRQGGDEFVIILTEITQPENATLVAEKIINIIKEPVIIREHELHVTMSIGITVYPVENIDDPLELMKKADIAMYEAKNGGRDGFRFYQQQGFTLLDMLIVIAILAIIGMAVIPQFQGMIQETRLTEAAAEIVSGMQYAGNLAVRYRRPFGFQADADGHWFKVYEYRYAADSAAHTAADPPVTSYGVVLNPLDKSWYLRDFDDMENYRAVSFTGVQIVFYPDGHSAASDTTVTASLGGRQKTIMVDGATGRISVE